MSWFDIGVATIFAREFLEGAIIVGNYRTVIQKSDSLSDEQKSTKLTTVTKAAAAASVVAILMIAAVAIPLGIASKQFDNRVAEIIEGVSKLVAAVAILGLSLKIPVWLGVYEKVPLFKKPWKKAKVPGEQKREELLPTRELWFNVPWNIWREVAECGVFLLPFFLNNNRLSTIPASAIIGMAIAGLIAAVFFYANSKMENKTWIAVSMVALTVLLCVGLFAGGCHEFEEVLCLPEKDGAVDEGGEGVVLDEGEAGEGAVLDEGAEGTSDEGLDAAMFEDVEESAEDEGNLRKLLQEAEGAGGTCPDQVQYIKENYCTPAVYCIETKFWDVGRFPMALFKPFGYSHKPTVLQTASWWAWFALCMSLHGYKWYMTKKIRMRKEKEAATQEA